MNGDNDSNLPRYSRAQYRHCAESCPTMLSEVRYDD